MMSRLDSGRNILDDNAIVAAIKKYVDEYLYDYAVMIDICTYKSIWKFKKINSRIKRAWREKGEID